MAVAQADRRDGVPGTGGEEAGGEGVAGAGRVELGPVERLGGHRRVCVAVAPGGDARAGRDHDLPPAAGQCGRQGEGASPSLDSPTSTAASFSLAKSSTSARAACVRNASAAEQRQRRGRGGPDRHGQPGRRRRGQGVQRARRGSRAAGRSRRRAGGRRRGTRRSGTSCSSSDRLAPGSGTIVRSPVGATSTRQVPVGRVRSTRKRTSTPSAVQALELGLAGRVVADRADEDRRSRRPGSARPRCSPPSRPRRRRSPPGCRSPRPAARTAARPRRPSGRRGRRSVTTRIRRRPAAYAAATSAASRALERTSATLARSDSPRALAVEPVEEERRDVLAVDAVAVGRGQAGRRAAGRAGRGRARRRARSGWRAPGRGRSSRPGRGPPGSTATSSGDSTRQPRSWPESAR